MAIEKRDVKSDVLGRLKRIAGQVTGVQRMVEEGRVPADILLQISAIQAALLETARSFLWASAEGALAEVTRDDDPEQRRKRVDGLLDLFARYFEVRGADK